MQHTAPERQSANPKQTLSSRRASTQPPSSFGYRGCTCCSCDAVVVAAGVAAVPVAAVAAITIVECCCTCCCSLGCAVLLTAPSTTIDTSRIGTTVALQGVQDPCDGETPDNHVRRHQRQDEDICAQPAQRCQHRSQRWACNDTSEQCGGSLPSAHQHLHIP
jgi:hypothetical protein